MLVGAVALGANAKGSCDVAGTVYSVDTTFHAYIGPGTTQTSMLLQSGNKHLRVFYTTVDLTNPYVKIRAVSATEVHIADCGHLVSVDGVLNFHTIHTLVNHALSH